MARQGRNVRQRVERPQPEVDPREIPRPVQPEADPAVPPVVHPGDEALHPFLRFTDQTDRQDRDILLSRASRHDYAALRYMSWAALQTLGIKDTVADLCGPHWRALFDITDGVSEVLTIEFLSTMHMLTPSAIEETEAAITFRLGGVERRMSLQQFGVAMGIYTIEDLDTPAFTEGLADFPEGVTVQSAWAELGLGAYKLPNPKSTGLRDHAFRIIHRAIAHGIAGHGISAVGNVMHFDLFYLYCMVHRRPVQIAERLARYLFAVRHQKEGQAIFGGGYVTRLATHFGVVPPEPPQGGPQLIAAAQPIDVTVLRNMGLVMRVSGGGYIFQPIVDPTIPPPPRSHDHEASGSGAAHEEPTAQAAPVFEAPPATTVHIPAAVDAIPPPPIRQTHETSSSAFRRLEGTVVEVREILRAEIAHAESFRRYTMGMLQLLAGALLTTEPRPEVPVTPQVILDFISRPGPSHTADQPERPEPSAEQQSSPPP